MDLNEFYNKSQRDRWREGDANREELRKQERRRREDAEEAEARARADMLKLTALPLAPRLASLLVADLQRNNVNPQLGGYDHCLVLTYTDVLLQYTTTAGKTKILAKAPLAEFIAIDMLMKVDQRHRKLAEDAVLDGIQRVYGNWSGVARANKQAAAQAAAEAEANRPLTIQEEVERLAGVIADWLSTEGVTLRNVVTLELEQRPWACNIRVTATTAERSLELRVPQQSWPATYTELGSSNPAVPGQLRDAVWSWLHYQPPTTDGATPRGGLMGSLLKALRG